MDKSYEPKQIEEKWGRVWLERNLFHSDAARGGRPYCIVIPPPNVTGILHMGHALNSTLQDILARWRRMQGYNVVWLPGTDHAGIATQNVVERALRAEGKHREDLGRAAFVARVWEWRGKYGATIINQLKRLGASCDWARERFTMDEGLSNAVAEVFVRLYDKGLIHRANYIINWCPRCHTALSDEESQHVPTRGKLYYLRYELADGGRKTGEHVVVATTRPETLLGDVALAVNSKDARHARLQGRRILLPVLGRELALIRDDFVDPEFGTGVVKVTPAHDPNDFELGRRHGLTPVNVMNGDGTMNAEAGPYAGLDRFECRRRIVADLEQAGLIEKIVDHDHAVGHCYRCDTVVEPRLSLQWFVKMKPLAGPAIAAVRDGRVRFVPERWTKVYLDWMENIRDWCISRQIWWGHRIPVFYCDGCGHQWAARGVPAQCPRCGAGSIRQDEDVLDTWFSSWLWPFSTFGWPADSADLKFYYPTGDLVTASEIIFFWVARMIVAGQEFMGDVPFRTVYIHGTVRDDVGRKMSKSLGNSIDPLSVIEEFSADALRFSLMMITATGQDVYVSNERFEIGRNFGTKLWNAARLIRMHSGEAAPWRGAWRAPALDGALLTPDDRHILFTLQRVVADGTEHLARYRFNDAAHALYEFVWHQFCDWYVESAKEALYGPDASRKDQALRILHYIFANALLLLQPMMPFLTEELWHAMGYGAEEESIALARWPEPLAAEALAAWGATPEIVAYINDKHDLIRLGRALRADYEIPPAQKVRYWIKPASADAGRQLAADQAGLRASLKAEAVTVDAEFAPAPVTPNAVNPLGTIYLPLAGLVDAAVETARITGQLEKLSREQERVTAKLRNAEFVAKAPREVVEQQTQKQRELEEKAVRLCRVRAALAGLK
jgi:valyl-tRNA synthetase